MPAIWEKQPYESKSSYEFFKAYLEQTGRRSLLKAYNQLRLRKGLKEAHCLPGSYGQLANGKKRNGGDVPGGIPYSVRVLAYDNHITNLELEKWQKRSLEIKEREWETSEGLLEKVQQMLLFPVMRQISEDGVTLIEPAGWSLRDIPALAQTASKLGRLSIGMETESVKVDWRQEAAKQGIDSDELFSEVVELLRNKLVSPDVSGGNNPGSERVEPG